MASKQNTAVRPVPAALPFTVDTWSQDSMGKLQIVTHAHKDHTAGIELYGRHICCSATTLALLTVKFKALAKCIASGAVATTILEDGDTLHLTADEDQGGYGYTVTALPYNNHCPGKGIDGTGQQVGLVQGTCRARNQGPTLPCLCCQVQVAHATVRLHFPNHVHLGTPLPKRPEHTRARTFPWHPLTPNPQVQ